MEEFDSEGRFIKQFGSPGQGAGIAVDNSCRLHKPFPLTELTTPSCKEFDPSDGDLYVAATHGDGGEGVYKFTAGGTELKHITIPTGTSDLSEPEAWGVAVDHRGQVWVRGFAPTDQNGVVYVYGDEEPNTLLSQLNIPFARLNASAGLALDSEDDLYALNSSDVLGKVNNSGGLLISEVDQEKSTAAAVNPDPSSGEFDDVYV